MALQQWKVQEQAVTEVLANELATLSMVQRRTTRAVENDSHGWLSVVAIGRSAQARIRDQVAA
jgi:hypothetical protein